MEGVSERGRARRDFLQLLCCAWRVMLGGSKLEPADGKSADCAPCMAVVAVKQRGANGQGRNDEGFDCDLRKNRGVVSVGEDG